MEQLTEHEWQVADKIIRKGFLKAAQSLSFFMKEEVGLRDPELQINNTVVWPDKGLENIHLLTTEVMGHVPGICYLILSGEEAAKLRETTLPAEIRNNPAMYAEMKDAILLEIDNIISASVITEFSNIFKQKMYGNVPGLREVNAQGLTQLLQEGVRKDTFLFSFKTQFVSPHLDFLPEFIWLFDQRFLDCIRAAAGVPETVAAI